MKKLTRILVAAALIGAPAGLQSNSDSLAQSGITRLSPTAYVFKRVPSSALHHQHSGIPRLRLWESTSGNWSCYTVPMEGSGVSDTFSSVQGTWMVPAVTGNKGDSYSSNWVGLDGYNDGTVEQIGTEQDWTGRGQQNYAWFEMYPSDGYEIVGFPVNPGDMISAQVQYVGQATVQTGKGKSEVESVFQLTILNTTKRVSVVVPTSYTMTTTAHRGSAEWVAEAPSTTREILPLADFGTAYFDNCYATSTRSGGKAKSISFWPNDPITMVDPSGGEAVPSGLLSGGTAFTVGWLK